MWDFLNPTLRALFGLFYTVSYSDTEEEKQTIYVPSSIHFLQKPMSLDIWEGSLAKIPRYRTHLNISKGEISLARKLKNGDRIYGF